MCLIGLSWRSPPGKTKILEIPLLFGCAAELSYLDERAPFQIYLEGDVSYIINLKEDKVCRRPLLPHPPQRSRANLGVV